MAFNTDTGGDSETESSTTGAGSPSRDERGRFVSGSVSSGEGDTTDEDTPQETVLAAGDSAGESADTSEIETMSASDSMTDGGSESNDAVGLARDGNQWDLLAVQLACLLLAGVVYYSGQTSYGMDANSWTLIFVLVGFVTGGEIVKQYRK